MNFMFAWQEEYLTSERSERLRHCSCHKNIKFISHHRRAISSIYMEAVHQGPNPYPFIAFFDRKHSPWFPKSNECSLLYSPTLAVYQTSVFVWDNVERTFKYWELLSLSCSGLMVSMLISGSRSRCKLWPGTLCSWARLISLTDSASPHPSV